MGYRKIRLVTGVSSGLDRKITKAKLQKDKKEENKK